MRVAGALGWVVVFLSFAACGGGEGDGGGNQTLLPKDGGAGGGEDGPPSMLGEDGGATFDGASDGAPSCPQPDTLTTVVSGLDYPTHLAIDASNLYWLAIHGDHSMGTIQKCSLAGCDETPITLSTGPFRWNLAARDSALFFQARSEVLACPITGFCAAPTLMTAGGNAPNSLSNPRLTLGNTKTLAATATHLYFSDSSVTPRVIKRCTLSDCAGGATVVFTQPEPQGRIDSLAANDAYLFFSTNGADPNDGTGLVMRCDLPDCASPTLLADHQYMPIALTVDDTNVYWINQSGFSARSCAIAGCANAPTLLADRLGRLHSIVSTGDALYLANEGRRGDRNGKIQRCALPACTGGPTTLVECQDMPNAIATDGTYIYWVNRGTYFSSMVSPSVTQYYYESNTGSIMRLPK